MFKMFKANLLLERYNNSQTNGNKVSLVVEITSFILVYRTHPHIPLARDEDHRLLVSIRIGIKNLKHIRRKDTIKKRQRDLHHSIDQPQLTSMGNHIRFSL